MKKSVLTTIAALGAAAAMVMGANASDLSADEILALENEASSAISELTATADLKADVSIDLPDLDTVFGVKASGNLDVAVIIDPLCAYVGGNLSFSAMGEGGDFDMEVYMVEDEDGTFGAYANVSDGEESTGWEYEGLDEEASSQIKEFIAKAKDIQIDPADLPFSFDLADETVQTQGHECYYLHSSLGWEELFALVEKAIEAAGEAGEQLPDVSELEEVGALLDGLVFNIDYYIDTESYLPIVVRIDTVGSDWDTIAAVFASFAGLTNDDGSLMNVNINVSDLYIEYVYDYDTPVEIVLPEEAKAAKENGNVLDSDDLAEALEQAG